MMKRKSLSLSARFFVFLMFAGVIACIAIPAEAQNTPEIEWLRIYKIPESALKAKSVRGSDGTWSDSGQRPATPGVWPPEGFHNAAAGYVTMNDGRVTNGQINGYVPIASDGTPEGCIPVTELTVFEEGEILGIAVKLNGRFRQISELEPDLTWSSGGPQGIWGAPGRVDINHNFSAGTLIRTNTGDRPITHPDRVGSSGDQQHEISTFTLLWRYKIRAGDADYDGGWFDSTPISATGGGTPTLKPYDGTYSPGTVTFQANAESIVYPVIDPLPKPSIDWIRIYKIPESAFVAQETKSGSTYSGRPVVDTPTQIWPPTGFQYPTEGYLGLTEARVTNGQINGYVPINSDGEPEGCMPVTPETIFEEGEILGIAIKLIGPLRQVSELEPDLAWDVNGPLGIYGVDDGGPRRVDINHQFGPRQLQASMHPDRLGTSGDQQHELSKFTLLWRYRVTAGDMDLNGGWFTNDTPFDRTRRGTLRSYSGANVAKLVTYTDYASIVYPKIDTQTTKKGPPVMLAATQQPVRFTDGSSTPIDSAPRGGHSRSHEVSLRCIAHALQRGDTYTNLCAHVEEDGWSKPALAASRQVYYYGEGDTIYYSVKFNEPVKVDPASAPLLALGGSTLYGKDATYHSGSGTDTLVFAYTVEAEDYRFSDLQLYSAFWDNVYARTESGGFGGLYAEDDPKARWIRDLADNRFVAGSTDTQSALVAYFLDVTSREGKTWWGGEVFHYNHIYWGNAEDRARQGAENSKVTNFLVDTLPTSVWIPGLIKNGDTHTDDKRTAVVNLDASYAGAPVTDFNRGVTESETQKATFDVEFRFFNRLFNSWDEKTTIADEIGNSFDPGDVSITGAGVKPESWQVQLTYVGLDHRATAVWPRPGHWTETTLSDDSTTNYQREWHQANYPDEVGHDTIRDYPALHFKPGDAKNAASFLVYKATITPQPGFKGNVNIFLDQGVTMDIARNPNLRSNTLTVPIDTRLSVETGQAPAVEFGAGAGEATVTVTVPFSQERLTYEGEHPPYITIYLGDEVPANARHATWEKGTESPGSTVVRFVYTGGDAGAVVIADVGSLTVPEGTRLVSGSVTIASGSAAVAVGPEVVAPVSDAPVVAVVTATGEAVPNPTAYLFIPVPEETEPKADATNVPRSPIVFNELGNGSGDTNDWLEFRNVTGSDVSLKDWELSVVQDGKQEDTSLVIFPDVSVPGNSLLLITNSDPTAEGNVLAGGDDVTTSEVEHKGSPHRYLVAEGLSLPDDGQFLLILRNAKEKLGLNEAFVDVAGGGGSGTDAFVRETTGDYDTHVWPLQVREAPGGNTEDALGSGKVWQRAKADIVGYHRDAWAEAAFTGIGYDRKVSQSAATAGTPGYPNGAVKTAADVPKGSITFSEIMVDSGGGTLPQWIELYNNSKTDAININRWKLEIQNVDSEELVGRPIVTLTLGEKLIQPNQTLLIVAGDARASSGTRLPSDRVYNLFKLHEKNLRIKSARDTFLSAEGFYLKLTDRNGTKIDEAGNIEGTRQRQESPNWVLAMSSEEGVRSSLIRRYTKGTSQAADGLRRGNWVLAANVKKVVDGELHWGHADDIGTPGHRAGGALPVELSSFSVTREEKGAVVLTWTTESEVDNAGFNLRRSQKRDGNFALINPALIAGAGTTGERQTYTFTDTSAKPGVEYYYQIEEVSFGGKPETLVTRMLPGPVSAAHRALVTFGEVKQRE